MKNLNSQLLVGPLAAIAALGVRFAAPVHKERGRKVSLRHVARRASPPSPERLARRELTQSIGRRQYKRMRYLEQHEGYADRHPTMALAHGIFS